MKGIADGLAIKAVGMVLWNLQDDQGRFHHIAIHYAAWVPDLPRALLSPQQANDHFSCPHGMYMQQLSNKSKLFWQQQEFIKTIPLDPKYKTLRFYSSSGKAKFRLFDKKYQQKFKHHIANGDLTFASIDLDS